MKKDTGSDRTTATNIQDLLTVCLARALDESLTVRAGADWFFRLKAEEADYDNGKKIIFDKKNVWELDFQALIKILYYRRPWAELALGYYGQAKNIAEAQPGKPVKETKFSRDLYSLMIDYRNTLSAHTSAATVYTKLMSKNAETGEYYTFADAIHCMVRVAKVFAAVKDERGKSYYNRIVKLAEGKRNRAPLIAIIIAATLALFAVVTVVIVKNKSENVYFNESNVSYTKNKLTVRPRYVYWDNGSLIAECFILNGKDADDSDITVAELTVYSGSKKIAKASFGQIDLEVAAGGYGIYTFEFPAFCVISPGANLSSLTVEAVID